MAIKKFNPKGLDSSSNVQILTSENLLTSNIIYNALTTVVSNIGGGGGGGGGGSGATGPRGATGATGPAGATGPVGATGATGPAGGINYTVTSSGSSDYIINGQNDPNLYLIKGFTYFFNVSTGGAHPFWIKTSAVTGTTSAYTTGITNNGAHTGLITFTVPFDAPAQLYYICQFHSTMVGNIFVTDAGSVGATGATGPAGPPGTPGTGNGGGGASVTISNTAPSNPSTGSFWFNSDSGEIFVYYYDGTNNIWVQPIGAAGPTGDPGSPGATGSAGAPGTPGTIWTRSTTNATTSGIANNTTANINIAGFKGYNLYKITSTHAAWIRLYTSAAARTADSSRAQGTDPTPDAGVVTEVITNTSPQTVVLAPAVLGFNDENPVTTTIPVAVTNLSGGSAAITVTLTLLKTED